MRFGLVLDSKFKDNFNIVHTFTERLKILNENENIHGDIFFTREIEGNIANTFAQYDAIYTRHTLPAELIEKIKLPIFAQHEFPFNSMGEFNSKCIYLTDASYTEFFPNAEKQTIYANFSYHKNLTERKYDILFLGRFQPSKNEYILNKSKSNIFQYIIFRILRNDIIKKTGSIKSSKELIKDTKFIKPLSLFLKDRYKIYWHLLHSLRNKRRELIVNDLYKLSKKERQICLIIDKVSKYRVKKHKNIDLFFDKNESEVEELMKNSKTVVVQTPMHLSIYNERFISALNTGCIPLVEPYPQYKEFFKSFNQNHFFDYSANSLYQTTENVLTNLDEFEKSRSFIEERCNSILSPESFRNTFKQYLKKYRN